MVMNLTLLPHPLEKHNNEWFVTYTGGAIFLKSFIERL